MEGRRRGEGESERKRKRGQKRREKKERERQKAASSEEWQVEGKGGAAFIISFDNNKIYMTIKFHKNLFFSETEEMSKTAKIFSKNFMAHDKAVENEK